MPQGRIGTVAILGNHDYSVGWANQEVAAQVATAATEAGAIVLRNEVTTMGGLTFAGLDDLWAGRTEVATIERIPPDSPAIVLAHNPDSVDLPGWDRWNGWILSGHTHGGQVKPPFLSPPKLPVRNRRYAAGEVVLDGGRRLYVSRGVGHHLKVRFNCRPEVTFFRLVPDADIA
jgi:predicted MPP superfamily phosphohydrolase